MPVKRVSPEEAQALMEKEGYVYVDVRSTPEFEAGHPLGAYNVPLMHMAPHGFVANPEFVAVMLKSFPKDQKVVVGCKSGGRSLQAVAQLLTLGYDNVVDQRAGFSGSTEPGWTAKGLPTSTEAVAERTYKVLGGKTK